MTLGLRRIQCFILSVVCGSMVNAQLVRLPVLVTEESWKDQYDYSLIVPIKADGQDLNLLVDTGTSEVFFLSKEWLEVSEGLGACEASVYGCYECTTDLCDAEVSEIEFCDGDCVSIVPLTGNLTIGGQEVPGVKFGLVQEYSGSMAPHASLGLAPQPEEDEDDYIPLLDQLVMKRVIKSTDFSIVFNPGNLSEGELILGGLDPSRYRGPMSFVPLKDGLFVAVTAYSAHIARKGGSLQTEVEPCERYREEVRSKWDDLVESFEESPDGHTCVDITAIMNKYDLERFTVLLETIAAALYIPPETVQAAPSTIITRAALLECLPELPEFSERQEEDEQPVPLRRLPIQRTPWSWKGQYDHSLLAPIKADGQDLNLLVDTGTHELFFISKGWLEESEGPGACEALIFSCYECTTDLCDAEVTNITFCDDSCASIVPLIGNLTIGEQEAPGVKFGLVGGHSGSLWPHASLGLAPQPEEDEDDYIPLLDQLVMKRIIESTDFSIVFNPGNLSEGELILGGLDPSRYRGPMSFVPLKDGYDTWTAGLKSIQVVGNSTPIPLTGDLPISIDSGCSGLYAPKEVLESIMSAMDSSLAAAGRLVELERGSKKAPLLGNCADREYLPQLQLTFATDTPSGGNDATVVIHQELYVQAFDTKEGEKCVVLIRKAPEGEAEITIGQNLLSQYFLYFQYGKRRIGFARTIEELSAPQRRPESPSKKLSSLGPD
ncbi:hypothetical protein FOZ61_009625 [Perkinsus olseni]|uniref:Peptidase A1 domain-containing protein n=1 Tax=Perkinsus olseni TaxID=32597 RepID=A0A7J6L5L3_PEROL|nr:hypothetical protein FOZ61_009625 [Perkinsus olseni]KAF4654478.1 hypothetical protein FOL46_008706 [Perkinsus olseni]